MTASHAAGTRSSPERNAKLPPQSLEAGVLIFVFEVRVKEGYSAEEYAAAWLRASAIIQSAPGARGTRLHRKIKDPDALLAIASWDSKAERDAAESQRDPRVQAILDEQAPCVEIRVLGEFEDPAWTALPPGSGASS